MKLKSLAFIALIFFMLNCENNSDKSGINQTRNDNTMDTEQEKLTKFGNDYTNAWNSQKPENVASFFAEEGSLIVNNGDPLTGRNDITEFAKGFMTAFPA